MTRKQRAKIYRRAAESVFADNEKTWIAFGCTALMDIAPIRVDEGSFPEFYLFRPIDFWSYKRPYWWNIYDDSRILALLFAEQIALNP